MTNDHRESGTRRRSFKEIAIAALEAGKHVLCEKPMALNSDEAREIVAAAKSYREVCRGLNPPRGIWCHVTGTDLVRDGDGQIYVLEDNLRVPSGVSYMLENRLVTKRVFPDLCDSNGPLPLGDYPSQLDEVLAAVMKLQENLHWGVGRDRKLASIGVYDLDSVRGPIRYRTLHPDDEPFEPLGMPGSQMSGRKILEEHPKGTAYAHLLSDHQRYPVLVDADGQVLSMPPIINSEDTRVSDTTIQRAVASDVDAPQQALTILTHAQTAADNLVNELILARTS